MYVIKRIHSHSGAVDFIHTHIPIFGYHMATHTLWKKRARLFDADAAASLVYLLNIQHNRSPYYYTAARYQ